VVQISFYTALAVQSWQYTLQQRFEVEIVLVLIDICGDGPKTDWHTHHRWCVVQFLVTIRNDSALKYKLLGVIRC